MAGFEPAASCSQSLGSRAKDITQTWIDTLDTAAAAGSVPPGIREAVRHLTTARHPPQPGRRRPRIKVYSRGRASRVTAVFRSVMRDDALADQNRTDPLIELIDELGLSVAEAKAKRFPITTRRRPPDRLARNQPSSGASAARNHYDGSKRRHDSGHCGAASRSRWAAKDRERLSRIALPLSEVPCEGSPITPVRV